MTRDGFEKSLLGKKWGKKWTSSKFHEARRSRWLSDATDLLVLLCSFLLTTASIALVALVSQADLYENIPFTVISILQRGISALSTPVTSAVIMVAGKHYVLFKLARGGIRSRKAAAYSSPSVGNLANYLLKDGADFPLLALLVVWALALATGLTVDDSWGQASTPMLSDIQVPSGPLDMLLSEAPDSSWVVPASQQLAFVMGSLCLGVQGPVGLIKMPSIDITSGGPSGIIYYPPLSYFNNSELFSTTTALNSFALSVEQLSSVPPAAQNITCLPSSYGLTELWYDNGDTQTLSIVTLGPTSPSLYRFNATAITLGGTLSSTSNYTEFVPNGTWSPHTMSSNQWAKDITSLLCSTDLQSVCGASSLTDFAVKQNNDELSGLVDPHGMDGALISWSTALGMAMGAYSSAMGSSIGVNMPFVPVSYDNNSITFRYGINILIANIVVSIMMLVVVVRLRMSNNLGADFLNSIRLLLDPLKNPELFNASLEDTIDALANPYLRVQAQDDRQFLLVEGKTEGKAKGLDGETESMD